MTRLRAGLVLLGALALVAAFADVAGDPYRITLSAQLPVPPSPDHLLGTDHAGRDTLARLVHGARVSLGVGISAALVQVSIGLALGVAAGFFGGLLDAAVTLVCEILLSFPLLLLLLAVQGVLDRTTTGSGSRWTWSPNRYARRAPAGTRSPWSPSIFTS